MVVVATAVAVIVLLVARWFFRVRTQQMQRAVRLQELFYHSANALAEDEGTPSAVLHMLSRMSDSMNSKIPVWLASWRLVSGHIRKEVNGAHLKCLLSDIETMRPEMRKHLALAFVSALFRVTYNNFFLGTTLRRLALFAMSVPNRAADAEENREAQVLAIDMFDRSTCAA